MNEKQVQDIVAHLRARTTEELQSIWKKNDRREYSDEGFEAVKRILTERKEVLPSQDQPLPPKPPQSNDWDIQKVKTRRTIYLLFFLLMVVGNIVGSMFGSEGAFAVNLIMGVVFLILFANIAKQVLGYSGGTLVGMSLVILFIPFFSLMTIAFVDRKVYDGIRQRESPTPLKKRRELCRWAVWSLVFFWIPVIGLLMGIKAVRDIRSRRSELYGATLAWIALVLGALDTLGIAVVTFCGIFIWK